MAGRIDPDPAHRDIDGPLAPQYRCADVVDMLHREVWGQGFAPTFSEEVQVLSQRLVGADKNHLSLKLLHHGQPVDGVWFAAASRCRASATPPRHQRVEGRAQGVLPTRKSEQLAPDSQRASASAPPESYNRPRAYL